MPPHRELLHVQLVKGLPFFRQVRHLAVRPFSQVVSVKTDNGLALTALPPEPRLDPSPANVVKTYRPSILEQARRAGHCDFNEVYLCSSSLPPRITVKPRLEILEADLLPDRRPPAAVLQLRAVAELQRRRKLPTVPQVDAEGFTLVTTAGVTSPDGVTVKGFREKRTAGATAGLFSARAGVEKKRKKKSSQLQEPLTDFYKCQRKAKQKEEWYKLRLDVRAAEQKTKEMRD